MTSIPINKNEELINRKIKMLDVNKLNTCEHIISFDFSAPERIIEEIFKTLQYKCINGDYIFDGDLVYDPETDNFIDLFSSPRKNGNGFGVNNQDRWNFDYLLYDIKNIYDINNIFVAFYGLNRLKRVIPNFYGIYAVAKEIKTRQCVMITESLLDEKYRNPMTMTAALEMATFNDCISWLIQIILSLQFAVEQCGFSHNNLHTDNIIIKRIAGKDSSNNINVDGVMSIQYPYENKILVLNTSTLAIITNYDLSHIKASGDSEDKSTHFGIKGNEAIGIYYNECRPFYDIFKILMWMIYILRDVEARRRSKNIINNENVSQELSKLTKFFGDDIINNIEADAKTSFIYSTNITHLERSRSINEFFTYLLLTFPQIENDILFQLHDFKISAELFPLYIYQPINHINRHKYLNKRTAELEKIDSDSYLDAMKEMNEYVSIVNVNLQLFVSMYINKYKKMNIKIINRKNDQNISNTIRNMSSTDIQIRANNINFLYLELKSLSTFKFEIQEFYRLFTGKMLTDDKFE